MFEKVFESSRIRCPDCGRTVHREPSQPEGQRLCHECKAVFWHTRKTVNHTSMNCGLLQRKHNFEQDTPSKERCTICGVSRNALAPAYKAGLPMYRARFKRIERIVATRIAGRYVTYNHPRAGKHTELICSDDSYWTDSWEDAHSALLHQLLKAVEDTEYWVIFGLTHYGNASRVHLDYQKKAAEAHKTYNAAKRLKASKCKQE